MNLNKKRIVADMRMIQNSRGSKNGYSEEGDLEANNKIENEKKGPQRLQKLREIWIIFNL